MIFLYVFDSQQDKSKQMNEQILSTTLEELKGYFKFLAFDCQDEGVKAEKRFTQLCEKDDHVPFFQVIKPAELRVNPYTKKPMQPTTVPYNNN
jgi:hypothetical protein